MSKVAAILFILVLCGVSTAICPAHFNNHYGYAHKVVMEPSWQGCFPAIGFVRVERVLLDCVTLPGYCISAGTEMERAYIVPGYTHTWICHKGDRWCYSYPVEKVERGAKLVLYLYKVNGNRLAVADLYVLDGIKWVWE